ncbi:MAG TPA: hypothetical protein VNS63_27650 [Blastocatellia bacterium]|nr:hypothetical protein [Blastocatellia bacterium]
MKCEALSSTFDGGVETFEEHFQRCIYEVVTGALLTNQLLKN